MTQTDQIPLTDCICFISYSVKCIYFMLRNLRHHETWIFKILKFDFLENQKSFWSEIKNAFSKFNKCFLLDSKNKLAKNSGRNPESPRPTFLNSWFCLLQWISYNAFYFILRYVHFVFQWIFVCIFICVFRYRISFYY